MDILTCEEIGHVWIQALHNIPGSIHREHCVIIAVEEPLEGVPQVPATSHLLRYWAGHQEANQIRSFDISFSHTRPIRSQRILSISINYWNIFISPERIPWQSHQRPTLTGLLHDRPAL